MLQTLQHILASVRQLAVDELFLGSLLVITLAVTFQPRLRRRATHPRTVIILLAALGLFWFLFANQLDGSNGLRLFSNSILVDEKAVFFKKLFMAAAIGTLLHHWVMGYRVEGEFFIVFWAILCGLCLLVMTTHLLLLYVAIELISISSYILVAMSREEKSTEAGLKYLLFGAATSAVMLYGISWLYGLTGTLLFDTPAFAIGLAKAPAWVVQVIGFMAIGGLLFKLSAAPFHAWTPDIYEVTPTPIVSFLSIAPKAAALLVLTRLVGKLTVDITPLLTVVIALSWVIGNFSAFWQTNSKRLLGYSSIAHAGFILVGLVAMSKAGYQASYFYVTTYLFLTMGAFLLLDLIATRTGSYELAAMQTLGQRDRWLGLLATVFMVGLVGLPPTIGFTGKLLIFSSLWDTYQIRQSGLLLFLLLFGLLNTSIALFYYLKIPYHLLVVRAERRAFTKAKPMAYLLLGLFAVATLYLFFNPTLLMQYINRI